VYHDRQMYDIYGLGAPFVWVIIGTYVERVEGHWTHTWMKKRALEALLRMRRVTIERLHIKSLMLGESITYIESMKGLRRLIFQ
jgi:hypothetical protein